MVLFLTPSPFEGEGWDGGRVHNQTLNPDPSHNENCRHNTEQ